MKWVPWVLFALALVATLYSFVLLLNGGAALTDARSEVRRLRERSDLALSIIRRDWLGREAASVTGLSRELEQKGTIVGTEDGSFEVGDLIFEVKDGLVANVRYID